MDPTDITAAIGFTPKRCWKAGEPRTTPTGRRLEGTNRETYWYTKMCGSEMPRSSLSAAIDSSLDKLSMYRTFLQEIRATGGRSEFFVGWFFGSQAGETFLYSTLSRMAELGIDLSLDNYHDPAIVSDED